MSESSISSSSSNITLSSSALSFVYCGSSNPSDASIVYIFSGQVKQISSSLSTFVGGYSFDLRDIFIGGLGQFSLSSNSKISGMSLQSISLATNGNLFCRSFESSSVGISIM